MGLFDFLRRLFFGAGDRGRRTLPRKRLPVQLVPLRRSKTEAGRNSLASTESEELPYRFARFGVRTGGYLDLSTDGDNARLRQFDLPLFHTPETLADWLELPVGKVAWLVHRFSEGDRPENEKLAHYHYHWIRKRTSGYRLIESPKRTLKAVQSQVLRNILDCIPTHASAHGFVAGRSIVSNARPHVAQRVVVKFDLENFYPSVTFSRVVAIFRSVGYSREVAVWLARLTTSALPSNLPFPNGEATAVLPYLRRHLPQGAPTSPALANLSAYSLDIRLSGLARSFGARYTRYADDLTFSGPSPFVGSLRTFIPLVDKIIRSERFNAKRSKRKVLRNNQRQTITGVVVNERTNICRRDFDRLKAILHNCVRKGPASQNQLHHDDFAAHLRGRVAHVMQLNAKRGAKLLDLYGQIDWRA